MFSNKKILLTTFSLVILPLCGCSRSPAPTTTASSSTTTMPVIDNLKSAMMYLNQGDNYTLEGTGSRIAQHSFIYLNNSVGLVCPSNKSADKIYYQDDHGVYSIGYNGKKYVGSAYYDDVSKEVWSGKFLATMKGIATDYINSIDNSLSSLNITNKEYRIGFLQTVGYSSLNYVDMDELSVKYENNALVYKFVYRKTQTTYTAKNFGTTENSILSNYLSSGGKSFTPSDVQSDIITKMKSNNYQQLIYQFGDKPETTGYIGKNYFNQNYFYTNYNNSLIATGHVALDGRDSKSGQYKDIYGCYSFVLDYSGVEQPLSIYPIAMYSEPNIPEFYNYPSFLSVWDHMEYCTDWDKKIISADEYTLTGQGFMILDPTLVYEIQNNFNIGSFEGAVPYAVGIDYIKETNFTTKQTEYYIVLLLKFVIGNYSYVMPVPFSGFGAVKDPYLEAAIQEMKN